MGLEFIDRVRRTSVATGIVVALIVWAYTGPGPAAAFIAGCVWSLVNIHLLRLLAGLFVGESDRRKLRIAAVLTAKVPVLYGAGYLLLESGRFPIAGLLAGFAWPLFVIVLKAAGRLILGLDRTRGAFDPAGSDPTRKGA